MTETTELPRCTTCSVPYRPHLTGGSCPVCDTPAPDGIGAPRLSRWFTDPDDRMVAIVVVATVLNVGLLALLAALVLNS